MLICLAVTPIMIRLGIKFNMMDVPSGRKCHQRSTPYLGGIAVFLSFWSAIVICFASDGLLAHFGLHLLSVNQVMSLGLGDIGFKISAIFAGSLMMLVVGMVDDKFNLQPKIKLGFQVVAAALLLISGMSINLFGSNVVLNTVATFCWILLLLNAFNFIDSVDGHCAGISVIASLFFFWVSLIVRQPLISVFVLTLGGAAAGFLMYNKKPARIFLGDNGSLFLGFMFAAATILCDYRAPGISSITPLIPIIIFGVPIYDTLSVVIVRIAKRSSVWEGDRNHFAHRLMSMGMKDSVAVFFSYLVCLSFGLNAILSTQIYTQLGLAINFGMFLLLMFIIAFLEWYAYKRAQVLLRYESTQRYADEKNER